MGRGAGAGAGPGLLSSSAEESGGDCVRSWRWGEHTMPGRWRKGLLGDGSCGVGSGKE